MTPKQALEQELNFLRHSRNGDTLGVAVSGGSDSMALLVLAHEFAKQVGMRLIAATVDHGLRDEAEAEAEMVAAVCASRGIAHQTLTWAAWDGAGNLQAQARGARYGLLADWAASHGTDVVLLGHTQDDQAETFLMSLARGSGVDGLAGMPVQKDGLFLRPLLKTRRADLREMLIEMGVTWADDPSNEDPKYGRVKARQMMAHLAELGLTTDRLVQTADHMTRAQNSLTAHAQAYIVQHVVQDGPDIVMKRDALRFGWSDVEPRVFAAAIMWIGGAGYRPRFKALCDAAQAVVDGETRTLHGVKMTPENDNVRLFREFGACDDIVTSQGGEASLIWDRRWRISYDGQSQVFGKARTVWPEALRIKALGESVSNVKNWRRSGLSHTSAMATPGVFDGKELISAPGIGFFNGFSTQFVANFHSSLLTH